MRTPGPAGTVVLALFVAAGCGSSGTVQPGTDGGAGRGSGGGAGRGSVGGTTASGGHTAGTGGGGNTGGGSGGLATGGAATGGTATGGAATGGAATGGAATGGAATGGAATGGAATGGAGTGGAASGGAATGGAATGGAATGGAATGGAATGGAATGGAATGGAGTGGAASGGAGTGGAASGGAGTGGAGTACTPGTWTADPVPTPPSGVTAGTSPTDSTFLDNSGHLHLVRHYDFPSTTTVPPAKRHWIHLVRPPGAQWTSGTVLFQASTNSSGGTGLFVDTSYAAYVVLETSAGAGSLLGETRLGAIDDDWFHPPPLRANPARMSAGFRSDGGRFVLKANSGGVFSVGDGTLAASTLGSAYADVPFKGLQPQADLDEAGTSHAAYLAVGTGTPMYASKTAGGAWTTPETTPGGILVVTPGGVPHLLRVAAGGLIESHRTGTGWVDQIVDPAGTAGEHGTDKLGRVHIAYATATNLKYARIAADGTITGEIVAATPASGPIRVDRAGKVRIYANSTIYSRCPAPADAFAASPGVRTTVTEFPNAPLPGLDPVRFVYDAARGRAVLYQALAVTQYGRLPITMEWNTATKTWATGGPTLTATPPTPDPFVIQAAGFDVASGKVLAVGTENGEPRTFRWDGAPTGWTAIANQNVGGGSGNSTLLGYDGPSSTFMAIAAGGALLRWTGTAWTNINSTGTTVPGTMVYDDERRLILAYSVGATAAVRVWEWNSTATAWVERLAPGGNVMPSGLGKMVTAGPGKMAFISESPLAVGEVTLWLWDATTAAWTLTRSNTRPYLDAPLASDARSIYTPIPGYAGQSRVLMAGPSNWDRSYEPTLGGTPPPAFLNLVTPTWEWTLP